MENEIIIYPINFRIPAKEQKQIKIFRRLKNNSFDLFYYLLPSISEHESLKNNILSIPKLLVIFRPQKIKEYIQIYRNSNDLDIVNNGNTSVLLDDIIQCDHNKECISYPNYFLTPKGSYNLAIKKNNKVKITKITHEKIEPIEINT